MIINAYRWRYIGRFMGEQLRLLPLHHSACRSTTARLLLPIWTWSWALKSVPPKYITNHWNGKMVENDVINNFKKSKLGLGFFLNSYRQTDIPDILNTWNARCPQFYNATTPLCTFLVPLFGIAKLLISIYFTRYARFFLPLYGFLRNFFLLFAKEVDVFVVVFFKVALTLATVQKLPRSEPLWPSRYMGMDQKPGTLVNTQMPGKIG